MGKRPLLRRLATEVGILPDYIDQFGATRRTTDAARAALLGAMGLDVSSEAAVRRELERRAERRRNRLLAPTQVARGLAPQRLALALPPAARRGFEWELEIAEERGTLHRAGGRGRGPSIPLPASLSHGYHMLRMRLRTAGGAERTGEQMLIVTPRACPAPREKGIRRQAFGILANLYTIRSERNWGVGDFGDLKALTRWSAERGADFVGLNPLHALTNRGDAISPYAPVSRLFRNLIYFDVEAVPELAHAPALRRRVGSASFRRQLDQLREGSHVDYEAVLDAKLPILRELHRTFVEREHRHPTPRGAEYRRYVDREGQTLLDFATFLALEERRSPGRHDSRGWHVWPRAYLDPRSPQVDEFRRVHSHDIDFHRFVQFELDRQLAVAAAVAARGGIRIGLYQDLALGSARNGADPWMFPALFLDRLSIGAPPDDFQPNGQDWNLPPLDVEHLADDHYSYWIQLVRGALRHAGALRIDHILGLFRQFWIPAGESAVLGAYVRFPADDLLGILALESTRAGALVIGEDLGTVPPGLPRILADWGILSTRVLYFERTRSGAFKSSKSYPAGALASVNTHDLIPLDGYWTGRDLELRRQVGTIATDAELSTQLRQRAREASLLIRRLRQEKLLPSHPQSAIHNLQSEGPHSQLHNLKRAVHAFLRRTPSGLIGFSLDDLAGETEPVNLPGVTRRRYPSWSRRMKKSLERIRRDRTVREAIEVRPKIKRPG